MQLTKDQIVQIFEDAVVLSIDRMGMIDFIDDQMFDDDDRLAPLYSYMLHCTNSPIL